MGLFSLLYQAFLPPLLTNASSEWLSFLSVINIIKLERFHRAASRAITSCLSFSPIPLFLTEAFLPPLRVIQTHFAWSSNERALCLPTSFPISNLTRLGSEIKTFQILLRPLARLTLRFSLLALSFLLVTCLSSVWSPPFLAHAPAINSPLLPTYGSHSPLLSLTLRFGVMDR